MKLEVGQFVRTILGISKLIEIRDGSIYVFDKLDEDLWSDDIADELWECELKDIVVKASFNIIDLIEVGDYVNGHKVKSKQSGVKKIDIGEDENYVWLSEKNIKTIITHDQIEQMSYRIGE